MLSVKNWFSGVQYCYFQDYRPLYHAGHDILLIFCGHQSTALLKLTVLTYMQELRAIFTLYIVL